MTTKEKAVSKSKLNDKLRVEIRRDKYNRIPTYTVWIVKGCQSFRMDFDGNKTESNWYAAMLRYALGLTKAPLEGCKLYERSTSRRAPR